MLSTLLDNDFYEIRPNDQDDFESDSAPLLNNRNNFKKTNGRTRAKVLQEQIIILSNPLSAAGSLAWGWLFLFFFP